MPGTRRPDTLDLLLVAAAVAIYGGRTFLQRPAAPESPFGSALPAPLVQRLDGLGVGEVLGDPEAPVRVTTFVDYQCAASAAAHDSIWPRLEPLVRAGRVHLTAYHLPLPTHEAAVPAATAVHCAAATGEPGDARALGDALLRRREEWTGAEDASAAILRVAAEAGLDAAPIAACVRDGGAGLRQAMEAGREAADGAGLTFTPLYAVDGRIVYWPEVADHVEGLLRARSGPDRGDVPLVHPQP
jgi:protein-disulfide isomerase